MIHVSFSDNEPFLPGLRERISFKSPHVDQFTVKGVTPFNARDDIFVFPIAKATAPSPNSRFKSALSCPHPAVRSSHKMFLAEPLFTASTAELIAIVAPLRESVKSAVRVSFGRSTAAAIMAAACFSLYGEVVLAKNKPSARCLLPSCSQGQRTPPWLSCLHHTWRLPFLLRNLPFPKPGKFHPDSIDKQECRLK